jgi:hypothetical protein
MAASGQGEGLRPQALAPHDPMPRLRITGVRVVDFTGAVDFTGRRLCRFLASRVAGFVRRTVARRGRVRLVQTARGDANVPRGLYWE